MKTFSYTIKDETGLHARPAGLLAKKAKEFESEILIEHKGRSVNATRLMMLMGLGIRCGDTVKVTVTGTDEETAASAVESFFKEKL